MLNWAFLMHEFAKIYVKEKLAKHFSQETGFTQVFLKILTTLGFRYRIISDKFLVF